jgi:ferredoxin
MCGLCTTQCPQGAIAEDNKTIDNTRCISCFRCIRNCPVQAKECITEEYLEFAERLTKKLAKRRENEYFI